MVLRDSDRGWLVVGDSFVVVGDSGASCEMEHGK